MGVAGNREGEDGPKKWWEVISWPQGDRWDLWEVDSQTWRGIDPPNRLELRG